MGAYAKSAASSDNNDAEPVYGDIPVVVAVAAKNLLLLWYASMHGPGVVTKYMYQWC